jgi:hypothetical protein
MIRKLRFLSYFLVVVITFSGIWAIAQQDDQERQEWRKAILSGTVEALDSYLNKYPEGKFASRIRIHKEELSSDLARRSKDTATSENVLKQGSGKRFKIEAKVFDSTYAAWRSLMSTKRGRV